MTQSVEFLEAATVPLDAAHASGTLEKAETLRAAHPEVASASIYAAAVLGDAAVIASFLEREPGSATTKGGPRNWDPLTYLCFSRYLRLARERWPGFESAAKALLDAGANANTGFYSDEHLPQPIFESALYGVAGIAHHPGLTRLLLERGADPNDDEVVYHTPEGWENDALKVLVSTGKLTPDSLATMLLRKTDWHDLEGVRWLLEHGADPNRLTRWGKTPLHNAALSDNCIEIFEALLEHGANPAVKGTHPEVHRSAAGQSPFALAARRGRGDVLALCEQHGVPVRLEGIDELLAACARHDEAQAKSLVARTPSWHAMLLAHGGQFLADFAGNGNTEGVRILLELGIPVDARFAAGNPYFDIARQSTALHVASWRARHETVRFLLARRADVNATDGQGRTPLALAMKACVDSYWAHRRSPESVQALLAAGASRKGVAFPSGYAEVDALLRAQGAAA